MDSPGAPPQQNPSPQKVPKPVPKAVQDQPEGQTSDLPQGLPVGVSRCLIGDKVRFDGQHKRHRFLCDMLAPYVTWVPVCPEVETGMGTPRPTVRIVNKSPKGAPRTLRLMDPKNDIDWTDRMDAWAEKRLKDLQEKKLCGFVLKAKSPSCGMSRVLVYRDGAAQPERDGSGIFAQALMKAFPNLPIEEEGRLADPRLRENFIERIYAYGRLQKLFESKWRLGDLVAFHSGPQMTLMAHSVPIYRQMGKVVANAKTWTRPELQAHYTERFMTAMKKIANPGRTTNALQHMAGYVTKNMSKENRDELSQAISDYRQGVAAPDRPRDPVETPHPGAKRHLPATPDLPQPAPAAADAAQPHLTQSNPS